MLLKFEARTEPSKLMSYLSPLIAVALTVLGGLVLFYALGKSPILGFKVFFLYPAKDLYGICEILLKATPLMLCAVGLSVGFRGNIWNIGAEGQYLMGALAGGGVALYFQNTNSLWVLTAMFMAGAIGGMLWAAIPAFLKTKFNANEILTSLMLVYVADLMVSWVVSGPWKDPEGFNFPQTRMFTTTVPLLVPGTRLTITLIFAILALIVAWFFMERSFKGFQLKVAGYADRACRYAGFSAKSMVWVGMLAGGAMSGFAGLGDVAGPIGQINQHISAGYGFAALIVAYLGRLNPIGIFLASLLMSLLFIGGEQAQQVLATPYSISKVFQGLLLFFLLASDVFINFRPRFSRKQ